MSSSRSALESPLARGRADPSFTMSNPPSPVARRRRDLVVHSSSSDRGPPSPRLRGASCFASSLVAKSREAHCAKRRWWSQTGSNRRPHACKARALPTELWPLLRRSFGGQAPFRCDAKGRVPRSPVGRSRMVGPGRLELPTSRLSGVRSNQLSYGPSWAPPQPGMNARPAPWGSRSHRGRARMGDGGDEEERETKTAASRTCVE